MATLKKYGLYKEPASGVRVPSALQKAAVKSFVGYYVRKDVPLTRFVVSDSSKDVLGLPEVCFFFQIQNDIAYVNENRTFAVSAQVNMQRRFQNSTIDQHVRGLKSFFTNAASVYFGASVLIVHEGRGTGLAAHYWPSEENLSISKHDPVLYEILKRTVPKMVPSTKYSDVYASSTIQLFSALMEGFKNVTAGNPGFPNSTASLWLMIESYENLHDSPCLPVDTRRSGMDKMLQRTTKQRIDTSLAALGGFPRKVAAFAWDSDFLCRGNESRNLASEILQDHDRPIITSCGFHSPRNLSVVITGFNIDKPIFFQVSYRDTNGELKTESILGYYFVIDYGLLHNKVPSLIYIMLRDMQGLASLKNSGYITVGTKTGYKSCTFGYTF